MTTTSIKRRSAVIFPKKKRVLEIMGENIKLARKRRQLTQDDIAERTGFSPATVRRIEKGDSTVSMGHYFGVLGVLKLADDFLLIASDDELGRKLQDAQLLQPKKRTRQKQESES